MESIYPLGPQNVPAELTRPTNTYKQRAWLAVISLGLFVILYMSLAGWFVLTAYRMLLQASEGAGGGLMPFIVGAGAAFLAVFMLKALFFVQRGSASDVVEVTASEQPRLFEFLYRLADEAGAPRPKKVFLSARVNAAVFYDLSILNLIFPSRKNLEIGLALVNVLTLSEMKAVLAHEFGHFAQRSMAIGSWVYIAQQIASHVVAKRDALDKFLRWLSHFDLRVAWIGWVLSLVVWSIRSLMDSLLRLVVLAQRALSRQMEFQADLVAVSLTGSDELVHALHKLQAADHAWSEAINFANAEIREGRLPHDMFTVQTQVIAKMAYILDDKDYGCVPHADDRASQRIFKTSFAQPPQMWSTHPASGDREENAKRVYLAAPHDARSAWVLFDDAEDVKFKVVSHLVSGVKAEPATPEQTAKALEERYALLQYDPRYRGAYLGRPLSRHVATAREMVASDAAGTLKEIATLYPARLSDDLTLLKELQEERGLLQALKDKILQATGGRIVHRGREISRRELPAAIRSVKKEEKAVLERVQWHDRQCRSVHLAAAASLGGGWQEYMTGLIAVLHYAEHTVANLRDAQGLLGNVYAIVTADGKVSSSELSRLIDASNMLHDVLARIHKYKAELQLDEALRAKLSDEEWNGMQEEFRLPPSSKENISDWLGAIDGWVNACAGSLASLRTATLESLLSCEDEMARHLKEGTAPEPAPAPSRVPSRYDTLLVGDERERQRKLDWWSRFQTADGVVAEVARLAIAGTIVVAVLGFGSVARMM